jgi:hypothetical protein
MSRRIVRVAIIKSTPLPYQNSESKLQTTQEPRHNAAAYSAAQVALDIDAAQKRSLAVLCPKIMSIIDHRFALRSRPVKSCVPVLKTLIQDLAGQRAFTTVIRG